MHLLSEAHDVLYIDLSAVIKDRLSAHFSEHLMLVGNDHLVIETGCPVEHRLE